MSSNVQQKSNSSVAQTNVLPDVSDLPEVSGKALGSWLPLKSLRSSAASFVGTLHYRFKRCVMMLVNRGPASFYEPTSLVATSREVDRSFTIGCRDVVKRGTVYSSVAIADRQSSYSTTISLGTNAASFAAQHPGYGVFDSRAGLGATVPLPRVQVQDLYNQVLISVGTNLTYLWTLVWNNYLNALWAQDTSVSVEWQAAVANATHVGVRGALLADYSSHGDQILSGSVLYLELPSTSFGADLATMRYFLSSHCPLRAFVESNATSNPMPADGNMPAAWLDKKASPGDAPIAGQDWTLLSSQWRGATPIDIRVACTDGPQNAVGLGGLTPGLNALVTNSYPVAGAGFPIALGNNRSVIDPDQMARCMNLLAAAAPDPDGCEAGFLNACMRFGHYPHCSAQLDQPVITPAMNEPSCPGACSDALLRHGSIYLPMSPIRVSLFQSTWAIDDKRSETLSFIGKATEAVGNSPQVASVSISGFNGITQMALAQALRMIPLSPNALVTGGAWSSDLVDLRDPRPRFESVWKRSALKPTGLGEIVASNLMRLFDLRVCNSFILTMNWHANPNAEGVRNDECGVGPLHNLASWIAYDPLCTEMLPERLRPLLNEVGALTDEAVAIRESFQNLEVQSRGVLIVEGQSHSVYTEMGPSLKPPSFQGTSILAYSHGPGVGIWNDAAHIHLSHKTW